MSVVDAFEPSWEKYPGAKDYLKCLKLLNIGATCERNKAVFAENPGLTAFVVGTLSVRDKKLQLWILTLFHNMLREDSSCFKLFEDSLEKKSPIFANLVDLVKASPFDETLAARASWLLSAIIAFCTRYFSESDISAFLSIVFAPKPEFPQVAQLEVCANLLKSSSIRSFVWKKPQVSDVIMGVSQESPPVAHYRCAFSLWMLSFDAEITKQLRERGICSKLRDILTSCGVEKVVRVSLFAIRNFLALRYLNEEMVDEGLLEAVQALDYEKWRDPDLYEEIREVSQLLSAEVNALSNYERYERELHTGSLKWGFIHSSKFWSNNVLKFEQEDFKVLKLLAAVLMDKNADSTTLAVACHDFGEFVTKHPLGKQQVAKLDIKRRVMDLMGCADPYFSDVRREALLCCQKIMLNHWQEVETVKS